MDAFTKFKNKFDQYGLEVFGKYYGHYKGFVFNNEDPEFRARLQIEVPQIYGEDVPDIWALSKGMFTGRGTGLYAIPAKGDPIWITFENGDPKFPIWEYGWVSEGDTPSSAKVDKNTNFVFQTGKNRLEFDEKGNKVTISTKGGFKILIDDDGVHVGKTMEGTAISYEDMIVSILDGLVQATVGPTGGPLINAATFVQLKAQMQTIQSKKITLIK